MALENDKIYNEFSFPTKFIASLAAGLPVIILANEASSIARMASRYHVGVTHTNGNPDQLAERLGPILAQSDLTAYSEGILACATAEFDARRMREKLYQCFRRCAEASVQETGIA
jgi:hypothetical protein